MPECGLARVGSRRPHSSHIMRKKWPILVACLLVGTLLISAAAWFLRYTRGDLNPQFRNDHTEKLVLVLDGVPYDLILELWERGHFRIFHRPSRLIAPFPSMTNVSAAAILGAEPPDGYESLYFDRASNEMVGGAKTYLRKRAVKPADYHNLLDYVEPRAYEFAVYGFPERIYRADLRRFFLAYADTHKRTFRAFLKSTDGLTHVGGKQKLEAALVELDRLLDKIHRDRNGQLDITIFSDHGNSFARCRRADLEGHLSRHGFRIADRLDGEDAVVIPGFGLVGYAAIYAAPSARQRLAEAIAQMPEAALVAYSQGQAVCVLAGQNMARIYRDQGRFRYEAVTGDPLDLMPVIDHIKGRGEMDADGYASDQIWFEALKSHPYPDAIFRLWQAVNGLVKNRADVLVSFKDGFTYGEKLFEFYSKLVPVVAIHGGLGAAQSNGFFMSTTGQAPPEIRAQQVSSLINLGP